jgi:hypothetical protein
MDSCGPLLATHFFLEKQVEVRAVADVITDEKTKKMMLRIAEDYETLANNSLSWARLMTL